MALLTATKLERIGAAGVELVRNISPTVPAPGMVWRPILPKNVRNPFARQPKRVEERMMVATDLVVFAVGLISNDALYRACVARRVASEICNIGDSFQVGRIFDAAKVAHATASALSVVRA